MKENTKLIKGNWVELSHPIQDHTGRDCHVVEVVDGRKLLFRPIFPHQSDEWVTLTVTPMMRGDLKAVPKHRVIRSYFKSESYHKIERATYEAWRVSVNPKESLLRVASAEKELVLKRLTDDLYPFKFEILSAQTYLIGGSEETKLGLPLTHDLLQHKLSELFKDKHTVSFNVLEHFKSKDHVSIRFEFVIRQNILDELF